LQREFPQVGPETMLGIEINEYAVELARVSVWIGHIQWTRRHGYAAPSNPVLQALETIECRDAILTPDGKVAEWPKADVIVGNPPFLGDKAMVGVMGLENVAALRAAYRPRVPGGADLVCFWFDRAREAIIMGKADRAGLVGTNSIRGGANRHVLDAITQSLSIFEAWSDQPWTVEGAAVRVSIICFAQINPIGVRLDSQPVQVIYADLTTGASNLTTARTQGENVRIAFNGIQKTGPFELPGDKARQMLMEPLNPNGLPNSVVLKPWWNGLDVVRRNRDMWIVDFGLEANESRVSYFSAPFAYLAREVRPTRVGKREARTNNCWWLFQWPRPVMRYSVSRLHRFAVTPEVSKHRIFTWCGHTVCPDKILIVIARDDDATLGILHSRFHELWALRLGTSLEDRPRYTPTTTFETFAFPEGLTPNVPATSYADNPHAQAIAAAARDLVEKRDLWLNPPDLVERVPEVVPGYPDRVIPRSPKAAALLKTRTLTNLYNTRGTPEGVWLDNLHGALDEAVAAAYGWPADLSEDEILGRLLALNHERTPTGQ
jgi:type II restriction/modification system DNA methylase subunit YeeA